MLNAINNKIFQTLSIFVIYYCNMGNKCSVIHRISAQIDTRYIDVQFGLTYQIRKAMNEL